MARLYLDFLLIYLHNVSSEHPRELRKMGNECPETRTSVPSTGLQKDLSKCK
jgi:hypothetical protein